METHTTVKLNDTTNISFNVYLMNLEYKLSYNYDSNNILCKKDDLLVLYVKDYTDYEMIVKNYTEPHDRLDYGRYLFVFDNNTKIYVDFFLGRFSFEIEK